MKPLIYKLMYEEEWVCEVQTKYKPNESENYEDWVVYGACGRGSTPVGAYKYWFSEIDSALKSHEEDPYYRSLSQEVIEINRQRINERLGEMK